MNRYETTKVSCYFAVKDMLTTSDGINSMSYQSGTYINENSEKEDTYHLASTMRKSIHQTT